MSVYNGRFYDEIDDGSRRSAEAIVPMLLGFIGGRQRVIDMGCGSGAWGAVLREHGCWVTGVDGPWARERAEPRLDRFIEHDLATPFLLQEPGDAAISLEVAEHLPEPRAFTFVGDLCAAAPLVVFSAAIPGQGGTHHVNERWPSYWAALFATHGFKVTGALRFALWEMAQAGAIENWYAQNMLVATNDPTIWQAIDAMARAFIHRPLALVHPVLYDARRSR